MKRRLMRELAEENRNLRDLQLTHPEMFRRCGDLPCCQALNTDGSLCMRQAMTTKTYIQKVRCCYLCWQHALIYGVYLTYKLVKLAGTAHLDWDTYCAYYPDECEAMLKRTQSYS